MKKITLTVGLLFATVAGLMAQTTNSDSAPKDKMERPAMKTPEERAKMYADRMQSQLKLDDNQKANIYNLALDREKNRADLRSESKDDRKAKFEKMKADQQAYNDKMNKILTPDQQTKFKDMQDNFRKRGGDRMGKDKRPMKKRGDKNAPEHDDDAPMAPAGQ